MTQTQSNVDNQSQLHMLVVRLPNGMYRVITIHEHELTNESLEKATSNGDITDKNDILTKRIIYDGWRELGLSDIRGLKMSRCDIQVFTNVIMSHMTHDSVGGNSSNEEV